MYKVRVWESPALDLRLLVKADAQFGVVFGHVSAEVVDQISSSCHFSLMRRSFIGCMLTQFLASTPTRATLNRHCMDLTCVMQLFTDGVRAYKVTCQSRAETGVLWWTVYWDTTPLVLAQEIRANLLSDSSLSVVLFVCKYLSQKSVSFISKHSLNLFRLSVLISSWASTVQFVRPLVHLNFSRLLSATIHQMSTINVL